MSTERDETPAAPAPAQEHTCHDMNPPFPGPCRACEIEKAETAPAAEPWVRVEYRHLTRLEAELAQARAECEQLRQERDVLVGTRNSDYAILLDAWRDRGEKVPGAEKESTVLRVARGIHQLRERAEQAEQERDAARAAGKGER